MSRLDLHTFSDGQKYLRSVPVEPVTDNANDWVLIAHPDGQTSDVYDVRSAAPGVSRDGSAFSAW